MIIIHDQHGYHTRTITQRSIHASSLASLLEQAFKEAQALQQPAICRPLHRVPISRKDGRR